ncbi:hypothetical protein BKA56DRAFT_587904 [Ilyonectria sp. MPI-CAGE-AT-0026]|nr:hypothetical protein BKA56DRAFT_587904 [Ilyonectria sp. MPI-CAGE-AT-0026]
MRPTTNIIGSRTLMPQSWDTSHVQAHAAHSRPAGPHAEAHASTQLRPSTTSHDTATSSLPCPYAVIPSHDNNNAHTKCSHAPTPANPALPSRPSSVVFHACRNVSCLALALATEEPAETHHMRG